MNIHDYTEKNGYSGSVYRYSISDSKAKYLDITVQYIDIRIELVEYPFFSV